MTDRPSDLVKSSEVVNVTVKNLQKETLGEIEEIVLHKVSGKVAYIVLNSGSFLGMGGKFFAVPWNAIKYDANEECFLLNVAKDEFKNAPGFDKDRWPNMADQTWANSISEFYSEKSFTE
jgi:hypothetical protein